MSEMPLEKEMKGDAMFNLVSIGYAVLFVEIFIKVVRTVITSLHERKLKNGGGHFFATCIVGNVLCLPLAVWPESFNVASYQAEFHTFWLGVILACSFLDAVWNNHGLNWDALFYFYAIWIPSVLFLNDSLLSCQTLIYAYYFLTFGLGWHAVDIWRETRLSVK